MEKKQIYEISQTYIRFDFKADSDFKKAFEQYLLYKGKLYAKEIYKKEILLDGLYFQVELEDGSLKSRLKIFGKIAIGALATYGGVRGGMDFLIKDSQMISQHIVQDIRNETTIDPNSIGRIERRLGVPGKIKRLYNDIEYLNSNRQNLTEIQQERLIQKIANQGRVLINELDEPETELIVTEFQQNNIPLELPQNENQINALQVYGIREEEVRLISEDEIDNITFRLIPNNNKIDFKTYLPNNGIDFQGNLPNNRMLPE